MKKFSKIKKTVKKTKELFCGKFIKLMEYDGYEYLSEPDKVIIIPHLIDHEYFILRKEYIPPFHQRDGLLQHITCVSGSLEEGETPIECVIRELREECGLVPISTYNSYENMGEFYMNKATDSKFHFYYVPLEINEFMKVEIKGDGTKFENMSSSVAVNDYNVENVMTSDLITQYVLGILREKIYKS